MKTNFYYLFKITDIENIKVGWIYSNSILAKNRKEIKVHEIWIHIDTFIQSHLVVS